MAHPGDHMLYICRFIKFLLSETTRHRALIFGMEHHLGALYQVGSIYAPVAKMAQCRQIDLGGWADAKNQLFQNMFMLHIKLKGMKHTITC